jgi:hypothetical protein
MDIKYINRLEIIGLTIILGVYLTIFDKERRNQGHVIDSIYFEDLVDQGFLNENIKNFSIILFLIILMFIVSRFHRTSHKVFLMPVAKALSSDEDLLNILLYILVPFFVYSFVIMLFFDLSLKVKLGSSLSAAIVALIVQIYHRFVNRQNKVDISGDENNNTKKPPASNESDTSKERAEQLIQDMQAKVDLLHEKLSIETDVLEKYKLTKQIKGCERERDEYRNKYRNVLTIMFLIVINAIVCFGAKLTAQPYTLNFSKISEVSYDKELIMRSLTCSSKYRILFLHTSSEVRAYKYSNDGIINPNFFTQSIDVNQEGQLLAMDMHEQADGIRLVTKSDKGFLTSYKVNVSSNDVEFELTARAQLENDSSSASERNLLRISNDGSYAVFSIQNLIYKWIFETGMVETVHEEETKFIIIDEQNNTGIEQKPIAGSIVFNSSNQPIVSFYDYTRNLDTPNNKLFSNKKDLFFVASDYSKDKQVFYAIDKNKESYLGRRAIVVVDSRQNHVYFSEWDDTISMYSHNIKFLNDSLVLYTAGTTIEVLNINTKKIVYKMATGQTSCIGFGVDFENKILFLLGAYGDISSWKIQDNSTYITWEKVVEELDSEEISGNLVKLDIEFEEGKYTFLKPSDAESNLEKLATLLKADENLICELHGYTLRKGNPGKNMILSKDRVKYIQDWLLKNKVKQNQITTTAWGDIKDKKEVAVRFFTRKKNK